MADTSPTWDYWALNELAFGRPRATSLHGVVGLLRDGDRETGLAIVGEVDAVGAERAAAPHVIALSGGPPLVRWLRTGPALPNIRVLGLADLGPADVVELARVPLLAQIERIAIVDRASELAPLFAACTGLRALAIKATHEPTSSIDAMATALAALRAPLVELQLGGVPAPIDTIAGNPALAGLAMLSLEACHVRGGELLGAFPQLRVFEGDGAQLDDDDVAQLVRCATLERIRLRANLGDAAVTAIANAALPVLRELELECWDLGPAGMLALERAAQLPALAQLRIQGRDCPREVVMAYATSSRAVFRAAARTLAPMLESWEPSPPPPDAVRLAALPPPPPGVTRSFVDEVVVACSDCGGSGRVPDGPCAYHFNDELRTSTPSPTPPERLAATVAATSRRLARAEVLCATIANELAARGLAQPARAIVWHTRGLTWNTPQPPPPFGALVDALGPPQFARGMRWGHACEAAALRHDPAMHALFAAVCELHELGYWLVEVTDDVVHAVMFPTTERA